MITRKKKQCKSCGRTTYIFARGLCKYCYNKTSKGIKKTKKKVKKAYGFASEKELFLYLWERSDKKCMISGKTLKHFEGTPKFWHMFAHILGKGAYPSYRLNPDNVWIVHPDVHDLYDNRGSDKQKKSEYDLSPMYKAKERLKKQYYKDFY